MATCQFSQDSSDGVPTPGSSPGVSLNTKGDTFRTQHYRTAWQHPIGGTLDHQHPIGGALNHQHPIGGTLDHQHPIGGALNHRAAECHVDMLSKEGSNGDGGVVPFSYGTSTGYQTCWHGGDLANNRVLGHYGEEHHSSNLTALLGVNHVGTRLDAPSTVSHLLSSSDLECLDGIADGSSEGSPSSSIGCTNSFSRDIFTSSATEILGPIISDSEFCDSDLSAYQGMMGPNLTDLQLLDEDPPLHYEPPSSPAVCTAQHYPHMTGYVNQARARYTTVASAIGGSDRLPQSSRTVHGPHWQGWKLIGASAPVH